MIARKCDICGKLYEERQVKGRYVTLKLNIGSVDHNHVWVHVDGYDICPECHCAVIKVIKERKGGEE